MAEVAERLAVLIEANTKSYERAMTRLQQQTDRAIKAAGKSVEGLNPRFNQLSQNMARSGQGAAAGVALAQGQVQNLSFQLNDLAQQLATGASPFTAIVQQGSQIVQVFGPGTGVRGALKAVGTAMSSFLLNPLTLATVGFGLAAQAAVSFFSTSSSEGKKTEDTLTRQKELIEEIIDRFGGAKEAVAEFGRESREALEFDAARGVETLRKQLVEAVKDIDQNLLRVIRGVGGGDAVDALMASLDKGEPDIIAFREAMVELGNSFPTEGMIRFGTKIPRSEVLDATQKVRELTAGLAELQGQIQATNATLAGEQSRGTPEERAAAKASLLRQLTGQEAPLGNRNFGAAGSREFPRNRAAASVRREAEAVAELISQLEFERSLIGMSEVEREVQNALREAGAAATEQQRRKIEELVLATYSEREASEAMREAQERLNEAIKGLTMDAARGFVDAFRDGKIEANELLGIVDKIADRLINMALENAFQNMFKTGGGGAGGGLFAFLGSLFGFGRAAGGPVNPGTIYPVGERGPEFFVPNTAGRIVPGGSGQGRVVIEAAPNPYFDVRVREVSGPIAVEAAQGAVQAAARLQSRQRALAG